VTTLPSNSAIIAENSITAYKNDDFFGRRHLQMGAVPFSLDMIYSGGLRAGFADIERLPTVVQFNAGAQISFRVPGVGEVIERLTVRNLLDRVNLIPPAEGIGIFQSAYGPRLTVLTRRHRSNGWTIVSC
jgi:hypothetical protein